MVEPSQPFQDSFGTLLWNKVAAAWQNNALHIGSYHRYKLPNAPPVPFTADGHDGQLDLALCERQRPRHGREGCAVDAERSQHPFKTSERTQVFVYCFKRDRFMFYDGIAAIEPVDKLSFFADKESLRNTRCERKHPPPHTALRHRLWIEGDDLFKYRLQHHRRFNVQKCRDFGWMSCGPEQCWRCTHIVRNER